MNNIFNIKSNYNFLESLVCWIMREYGSDPLYLSKITILLPSRRSCRVAKEIFLKQSLKNAIILPNIKAIGDVDFDDIGLHFLSSDYSNKNDLDGFKKLISGPDSTLKYHCLLIDEIRKFNQKTNLFGKNITTNQIDLIASNLEDFLNEVDREELDLDNLENIEDVDLAGHRQRILQFLRHFGSNWRKILLKNNIRSASLYQRDMIDVGANYLKTKQDNFPVIAAGSTGSLKATSRLLKTILDLDNGFVFLQGLDQNIAPDIWEDVCENHPQFMLKRLLKTLGVNREEVINIEFDKFKQSEQSRLKLLYYSFLPASKTDIWTKINDLDKNSIDNLSLIECNNNFDEATIIALKMIEELQDKTKNIALITNNQDLAMMVKEILLSFDINVDNSKNNKLFKSEIITYLVSIAIFCSSDFKVSNLLTILKNRITRVGFGDDFYENNLKLFEIEILRKNFSLKNIDLIITKIEEFGDQDLMNWFLKIKESLLIFDNTKDEDNFLNLVLKNLECAKALSSNFVGEDVLSNLSGLEEFNGFIDELRVKAPSFKVENEVYHKILVQFLSNYNFDKKQNHHPRLHILSPIEARLMNFDVMIISNLNEGDFIAQVTTQNWLSRNMRLDFGLPDLTRKVGVSAFDFSNYLGNKKVFLTRSLSSNNSPTSKLRFLMKFETILKATKLFDHFDNGKYWHFLLKKFNSFEKNSDKEMFLANPDLNNRLKKVSVTDVGKWIRDPYYVYAKRILDLKPLNKVDEEASFASFGNFVHKTLEEFVKDYDKIDKNKALSILLDSYAKKYFVKYFVNKESYLLWWPRFENIASWFIKNEINIRKNLKNVMVEIPAKIVIDDLEITTKIDRVNIDLENNIEIIDYKTGLVPTNTDVKNGLDPQLPLESLILLSTKGFDLDRIGNLHYYSLKGRDRNKIQNVGNSQALMEAANLGIKQLIQIFNKSQTPFYSNPDPEIYKANEYSHLARIDTI